MSSLGHGEMTKYFCMFTMRGQGTLEPVLYLMMITSETRRVH
jgi:hypothetical protein